MNNLVILTVVIVGVIFLVDLSHEDDAQALPVLIPYNQVLKGGFRQSVRGMPGNGDQGNTGGNAGENDRNDGRGVSSGSPSGGGSGNINDLVSAARAMAQRIAGMGIGGGK